jgi:uncharacterized protein (DUF58 family)
MRQSKSVIFYSRTAQGASVAAFVLFLLAVATREFSFAIFSCVIFALLLLGYLYLRVARQNVEVEADWSHHKRFAGETLTLTLTVKNYSSLFLLTGTWLLRLTKKMNIRGLDKKEDVVHSLYESKFMASAREPLRFTFEVELVKRGVAAIDDLIIRLEDPLGVGNVDRNMVLPKHEIVIYPRLVPVGQLDLLNGAPQGDHPRPFSLYEDPTFIMGARPYRTGDSFNRLDWKATARRNELHTKVLERTMHSEYVLIGNVHSYENKVGINEEYLERTISVLASLSHHVYSQNVPFQILFNMKRKGALVRIYPGEGRNHFMHTLESLARILPYGTIPFEQAVYHAGMEYQKGRVFVLVTPYVNDPLQQVLAELHQRGIPVYLILTDREDFVLQRVGQEVKRYA